MIRILLAEDQAMVRGALAALLSLEPDMEIVAEVGRGDEVLDAARSNAPDVALLDIEMPGGSGIVAAAQLHELLPSCRILMLTTFGHPGYLKQAIQGGAVGFLTKDAPTAELASAIRRVLAGARVIDPKLAVDALGERDNPLTERERDVLAAAGTGASVADIASRLFLSVGTVRNYLSNAIQKTYSRNRIEAFRVAKARGWLPDGRSDL
ncbi:MAG: response regulator transcription factor [Rectinemataceae bacterium]